MYKLHLILKYLRKRRIAWVSLLAVMLCTAMVLIVFSVMSGWLRMFKDSFQGLTGSVVVQGRSLTGFGHYEAMIEQIEQLPGVAAAVPTINTFGLINIDNRRSTGVQIIGVPIERIGKVNRFPQSLYLQYQQYLDQADEPGVSRERRRELLDMAEKARAGASFAKPMSDEEYDDLVPGSSRWNGMIVGGGVVDIEKNDAGEIVGRGPHIYRLPVKLTVLAITPEGFKVDVQSKSERPYWIVDDSRTKLWQYDSNTVYVPFDVLQLDLDMQERAFQDKDGNRGVLPARANEIQVAALPGVDLDQLRDAVDVAVRKVQIEKGVIRPDEFDVNPDPAVRTWIETQARFLDAVQNEVSLVTVLFSMISMVAVFLVFTIFYMIVAEKTKDIGIVKSVGATDAGVAGIFIGYGAVLGLVGGLMGLGLGYLVVRHINFLHTEILGKRLGLVIWKPSVYQFDTIPNQLTPYWPWFLLAAVLSAVVGAIIPAIRAARLHPVEALRWE